MGMLARITKKVVQNGESFLINGTTPAFGFFKLLDSGSMHNYLDDTEVTTVIKPGLYLVVPPSTPINMDDTIVRDGRTFTVRKVGIERFAGTALLKVAILS